MQRREQRGQATPTAQAKFAKANLRRDPLRVADLSVATLALSPAAGSFIFVRKFAVTQ